MPFTNKFFFKKISVWSVALAMCGIAFFACEKSGGIKAPFDTKNSLTLFKAGAAAADLTATDTVFSQSGINGKFIPVSGSSGAVNGLQSIAISLSLASNDSVISTKTITTFFRQDYHVLNEEPILIPTDFRGKLYRIEIEAIDKQGTSLGTKQFLGLDVLTCDPLPPCLVANQVTILVETPDNTPLDEDIFIFGSINGYSYTTDAVKLNKNPDVPNCYCATLSFAPGQEAWQLNELFFTRGSYSNNATTEDNSGTFILNYTDAGLPALWKVKVPRWRDR